MPHWPNVIEQTHRGQEGYDLLSRLLKDRIILLNGVVHDELAASIVGQLLFLESDDADKDIMMYINSPGGSVTAGLAIYDTMQYVRPSVSTCCFGQAASMGAVLLAAGANGKRYSLPNSRVMIHQPHGGAEGQAVDIEIQAKEIIRMRARLNEILAKHCKQPVERIEKDADRDYFMSASEAKEYGLIDEVYVRRPVPIDVKKTL